LFEVGMQKELGLNPHVVFDVPPSGGPRSADIAEAEGFTGPAGSLPEGLRQFGRRRRMRRHARLLALVFDVLAITMAFMAASLIRFGQPVPQQGLNMIAVVLPIYLVIAANNHAYGINAVARARAGGSIVSLAFLVAISAVALAVFFLKVSADFSRAVFGVGAALAIVFLPLSRLGLAGFTRRLFGQSALCEVVLEDGVRAPSRHGAVVLDAKRHGLALRLDDPMMLDRLGRCLINADRVIVACPPERRHLWATALRGADVNAEVFATDLDELGAIGLSNHDGCSTLVVAAGPLGVVDRSLKRLLDLILTIASFPVTLPLLAVIAIAVKLDSPGPILFAQQRVGLGNRIFKMYKFRSMRTDQTDSLGDRSTHRGDSRVTRLGRFIRATSIDELPQLFNVLSGAMSIVGPRPHALLCKAEDRLFWDIDLRYWHRHAMKPGLTGLAQVRGLRGATEKESQFTDRLQSDLEYLVGWSIWRDLRIIMATFRVLVHRNAF
jgi:exopolysaccharide biosynthesis polyprenyl glycosylphosphotransferase